MGVEESKLVNPPKHYDQMHHTYSLCTGRQWTLLHNCRLDIWQRCHSEIYNFPDTALDCPYSKPYECTNSFCLSRQNIINLNKKKNTFSFRKQKKQSKIAEHFEYNHIPAHLSSVQNLHFKSILCTGNGLAIVHLTRNLITQFGVLDMHIYKFLGTFGRQSVKYSPNSVAAQISPDGSWCLIRLPWSRNNRVTTLQLYSLRTRELISEIPLTLDRSFPSSVDTTPFPNHPTLPAWSEQVSVSNNSQRPNLTTPSSVKPTAPSVRALGGLNLASSVLFDFDPRYLNTRIVITNVHISEGQSDVDFFDIEKPILSLIRLPSWQRLAQTRNFGEISASPPDRNVGTASGSNRRRRSSIDFTLANTGGNGGTNNVGGVNILKVFYSLAGHLIFAVVTNTSGCRCTSVHSVFPTFSGSSSSPLRTTSSANSSPYSTSSFYNQHQRLRCIGNRLLDNSADPSSPSSELPPPPPFGCISLFLVVFHSDTLEHLRVIRFDRPVCPLHTCPTNYVPMMSKCGSRIALVTMTTGRVSRSGISGVRVPQTKATKRMSNTNVETNMISSSSSNYRHVRVLQGRSRQNVHSWTDGNSEQTYCESESTGSLSGNPSPGWQDDYEFSRTGSRRRRRWCGNSLSQCTNGEPASTTSRWIDSVFVYQLEPPPSLQAIARQQIRRYFPDSMLEHLGLPPGIVAYLRFEPSFFCSGSCLSRSESSNLTVRSNSLELL